jgi:DeoR family transcriptional regulator, glycerol-3-phosphate regulon repressor
MKQSLRYQKIIEIVKLKGYASTEELVIELEVSPQTIRRDLNIQNHERLNKICGTEK